MKCPICSELVIESNIVTNDEPQVVGGMVVGVSRGTPSAALLCANGCRVKVVGRERVRALLQAVGIATPCSVLLPEIEQRVLFFVPTYLPQSYRWKTGHRVPDGYHDAGKIWRDDETSVGDELKLYTADQVTHWMPMPGEPT